MNARRRRDFFREILRGPLRSFRAICCFGVGDLNILLLPIDTTPFHFRGRVTK